VIVSVDFAEVEVLQREGRWDEGAAMMVSAAQSLERAGAGCVVLATNTMHKLADAMQAGVCIPLLHIADATAERICKQGMRTVGLLGTRFTMEEDFYKGRLADRYGLNVLIPEAAERGLIHRVIYDELCLGIINAPSRDGYRQIITGLIERGAQGIILGCTEIDLLVKPEDSQVPLFDTTRIHAEAAVDWSLT
jgi:aspartate racemase